MAFLDSKQILSTITQSSHGLSFAQLCKTLSIKGAGKDELKKQLKALVKKEKIIRQKNKTYIAAPDASGETVIGRIDIHEKGFGFVTPEDGIGEDIFIPGKSLRGASHLEKVKVQITRRKANKKVEGRVIEVISEDDKEWIGVVFAHEKQWFFCPWGQRVSYELPKDDIETFDCRENDIVLAKLHKSGKRRDSYALMTHLIGNIDDPGIDSEILIHEFDVESAFPQNALAEAQNPSDKDACASIRKDLNHLPFVTIDGEDAKDFDDAVYMDKQNHLWVAIADVSRFVQANSNLDIEACARGNSYYFPDQVVPMLPENLSNFLCSLRPEEEKYAMVVEIAFDQDMKPQLVQVTPALITSKARLTYNQVHEMLRGKGKMDPLYKDSINRLAKVTKELYQTRIKHGAIDFDMPEVRFFSDELTPKKIERNAAHRMIEECMLATNEVTSRFVDEHGYPNVFRVHEPPDPTKLEEAATSLNHIFNSEDRWRAPQDAFDIQDIMQDIKDHPFYTQMQYLFLRAMSQARYSTERLGHFGLGFEYYSHFTSPIRRYADLTLHRIIKRILLKHDMHKPLFPKTYQTLNNVCVHISKQDRKSLLIEREMKKIKGIRFMQTQHKQKHAGVISGVLSRGVFVETTEYGIEGLIDEDTLKKAGYRFHQDSSEFRSQNNVLCYGSPVQVEVAEANLFKRQLDFKLCKEQD